MMMIIIIIIVYSSYIEANVLLVDKTKLVVVGLRYWTNVLNVLFMQNYV